MQRYLVERTFNFDGDLGLPGPDDPPRRHLDFAENNARDGVIWLYSYVSHDNHKSFCIYDAPNPEAIRRASKRNGLPVDRITEVCLLAKRIQFPRGSDFADCWRPDAKIRDET